ncbi:DUF72 domain-containing protein [Kineococcus glutinatus]|uniref:DUF72 domain-containing protein n=1 Tax=Kineococcus glutinatus TaxID=1070872 RepID=A0ABP9HEY6_9ACTN
MGTIRVGTSGWTYAEWRGTFYPPGLPRARELEHTAAHVATVELNASFHALQRPTSYASWARRTPPGFCFAVKGWREVTHDRRLVAVEGALADFFGSGLLALGDKLGPVLWQLPPSLRFDAGRLAEFCALLPRTTAAAAELAAARSGARVEPAADRPLRHALEVRNAGFARPELVHLLREQGIALVASDSPRLWPALADQTADFAYVRLHGATELYASGYDDAALDAWAERVRCWAAGTTPPRAPLLAPPDVPTPSGGRDVYVYFDNTRSVRAPYDAAALVQRLG